MSTSTSSFWRDGNRVPITQKGIVVSEQATFTANGTVTYPIFHVTGTVLVLSLYGVVTTAIGSNHTAAYWRINDQGATPAITLATGTTISTAGVGSVLAKFGLAGAALTLINNSAGRVNEPTTLETDLFSPFSVMKKTGAVTDIEYCYTTNNTSLGEIKFYAGFIPVTEDGDLTAV
jgi:hypothetical protein